MVGNLQKQLDLFKEKVKEKFSEVIVSHRPGYVGGGAVDDVGLLAYILLGGAKAVQRCILHTNARSSLKSPIVAHHIQQISPIVANLFLIGGAIAVSQLRKATA
jgi:hypothetical protein